MEQKIPAICFTNFSLSYLNSKAGNALQALKEISFTVFPGEIITIVGPSGCGKTTLLRSVAGLLRAKEDNLYCNGSLQIFGMPALQARQQRMFAFTFQNPVLLPWRNVRQNVALPLEIMDRRGIKNNCMVDEMLSMVGISDFDKSMPSEISGGMQQRANLARALVQEPKILLMDEPFGSLDEVTRERLNFELLRIHRVRKPTILFVTHSLSEAALLSDRILVLSRRPATVRADISIRYNNERNEDILLTPEYLNLVRNVREVFANEASEE